MSGSYILVGSNVEKRLTFWRTVVFPGRYDGVGEIPHTGGYGGIGV